MRSRDIPSLRRLARSFGILPHYTDVAHRRREVSPETLEALLGCFGCSLSEGVDAALRRRMQETRRQALDPVSVSWRGRGARVALRLPAPPPGGPLRCRLELEDGRIETWSVDPDRLRPLRPGGKAGADSFVAGLSLPRRLPVGYHLLRVELAGRREETLVLSAPVSCYGAGKERRDWGVFAPLYAVRSEGRPAGDLGDLAELMQWTASLGGGVVGTLPLLPAFLDHPYEPSPYSPVTRLLWNEFYVDMEQVPELQASPEARALLRSAPFRRSLRSLAAGELVDYRKAMRLKRKVLEVLSRRLFRGASPRRSALERFLREHPVVRDYARFRAVCESQRRPWKDWPQALRDGRLRKGDFARETERYYLYAQWLAHDQMACLSGAAARSGVALYLDLPLGVHRAGFDVWREKESYALDATAGAPPDTFFTRGQDWSFAPLHPRRLRERRYDHLIAVLRHHMRNAGMLRIDHVMGLRRLYWIPRGFPADAGAYVRYPAEDLYAILSIESHRNECALAGENLGTVPPIVNADLKRHGIRPLFVVQYEVHPEATRPLRRPPDGAVAGMNTHDMPPWKAFWDGLDIEDRRELGLIDTAGGRKEHRQRRVVKKALAAFFLGKDRAGALPVLKACLRYLGGSRSGLVLANIEDLWLETQPQNMPGTTTERINWRRKLKYSLQEIRRQPQLEALLGELDDARRRARLRRRKGQRR